MSSEMKTRWEVCCLASDTWTLHCWTLLMLFWRPDSGGFFISGEYISLLLRCRCPELWKSSENRFYKMNSMYCKRSSEMCLWGFQAAVFCWARPQEAAGRPGVLQQICRGPALQSQTQLHLCLPAAHAGLQEEVGSSKTQNLSVTLWQTRVFFRTTSQTYIPADPMTVNSIQVCNQKNFRWRLLTIFASTVGRGATRRGWTCCWNSTCVHLTGRATCETLCRD